MPYKKITADEFFATYHHIKFYGMMDEKGNITTMPIMMCSETEDMAYVLFKKTDPTKVGTLESYEVAIPFVSGEEPKRFEVYGTVEDCKNSFLIKRYKLHLVRPTHDTCIETL